PAPLADDAERIRLWVEIITGMQMDAAGALHALDAESWHERRRQLKKLGGSPATPRPPPDPELAKRNKEAPVELVVLPPPPLAPRRVTLKLARVPLRRALAALGEQVGTPIEFVARTEPESLVDLDLDGVPFWEALDRLCRSVKASWGTGFNGVRVTEGGPSRSEKLVVAGPFCIEPTRAGATRSLDLRAGAGTGASLSLSLESVGEFNPAVLSMAAPQVVEAVDEAGRSLAPPAPP